MPKGGNKRTATTVKDENNYTHKLNLPYYQCEEILWCAMIDLYNSEFEPLFDEKLKADDIPDTFDHKDVFLKVDPYLFLYQLFYVVWTFQCHNLYGGTPLKNLRPTKIYTSAYYVLLWGYYEILENSEEYTTLQGEVYAYIPNNPDGTLTKKIVQSEAAKRIPSTSQQLYTEYQTSFMSTKRWRATRLPVTSMSKYKIPIEETKAIEDTNCEVASITLDDVEKEFLDSIIQSLRTDEWPGENFSRYSKVYGTIAGVFLYETLKFSCHPLFDTVTLSPFHYNHASYVLNKIYQSESQRGEEGEDTIDLTGPKVPVEDKIPVRTPKKRRLAKTEEDTPGNPDDTERSTTEVTTPLIETRSSGSDSNRNSGSSSSSSDIKESELEKKSQADDADTETDEKEK